MLRSFACLLAVLLTGVSAIEGEEAAQSELDGPMTQERALALGLDGLLAMAGGNPAHLQQAASLYETARRIDTESSLARKDLNQVEVLGELRRHINDCRQGAVSLEWVNESRRTWYVIAAVEDMARVEEFLGVYAVDLPILPGQGSVAATEMIDERIAVLKNLKPPLDDDPDDKLRFEEQVAETIQRLEALKPVIDELPAPQAEKVASFVADPLSLKRKMGVKYWHRG